MYFYREDITNPVCVQQHRFLALDAKTDAKSTFILLLALLKPKGAVHDFTTDHFWVNQFHFEKVIRTFERRLRVVVRLLLDGVVTMCTWREVQEDGGSGSFVTCQQKYVRQEHSGSSTREDLAAY